MSNQRKLNRVGGNRTTVVQLPQMYDLKLQIKQLLSTYNALSDVEKRTVLAEVGAWISSKPRGIKHGPS